MAQGLISFFRRIILLREISSLIMLLVVVLVFSAISPLFLSLENVAVILEIIPELGIVALGGKFMLMISGELIHWWACLGFLPYNNDYVCCLGISFFAVGYYCLTDGHVVWSFKMVLLLCSLAFFLLSLLWELC